MSKPSHRQQVQFFKQGLGKAMLNQGIRRTLERNGMMDELLNVLAKRTAEFVKQLLDDMHKDLVGIPRDVEVGTVIGNLSLEEIELKVRLTNKATGYTIRHLVKLDIRDDAKDNMFQTLYGEMGCALLELFIPLTITAKNPETPMDNEKTEVKPNAEAEARLQRAIEIMAEHYYKPLKIKYPTEMARGGMPEAAQLWKDLEPRMYAEGIPHEVYSNERAKDLAHRLAEKQVEAGDGA